MSWILQLFLILCVLIYAGVILRFLLKKKLNLKYTLVWLLTAIVMLVIAIFPQVVTFLANLIGIQVASNAVFFFALILLFLIVLTLTVIVSHMNNRVYRLTQMQALLEKRVRQLEEQLQKKDQ